jgi:uncharacterized protein (DUF433 family)
MENQLLQRITLDPNICHGKPCIRGLRYPVEFILELLSSGMNAKEIIDDYSSCFAICRAADSSEKHIPNISVMKFLVDAQLPLRLARVLQSAGCDTIHTKDLPRRNATLDS